VATTATVFCFGGVYPGAGGGICPDAGICPGAGGGETFA